MAREVDSTTVNWESFQQEFEDSASKAMTAHVEIEPETYGEHYVYVTQNLFKTHPKKGIEFLKKYIAQRGKFFGVATFFSNLKKHKYLQEDIARATKEDAPCIEEALVYLRNLRQERKALYSSSLTLDAVVEVTMPLVRPFDVNATFILAYELGYVSVPNLSKGSPLEKATICDAIEAVNNAKALQGNYTNRQDVLKTLCLSEQGFFDFDAALHDCGKKIASFPEKKENYTRLLRILLEKDSLAHEEIEYAKYAIYMLEQLEGISDTYALAQEYYDTEPKKEKAFFILHKLYTDGIQDRRIYNLLSVILDNPNTFFLNKDKRDKLKQKIDEDKDEYILRQKIERYQRQSEANPTDPNPYITIASAILDKETPTHEREEYVRYCIFKATELGGERQLIEYAQFYSMAEQYAQAEFILAKLVADSSTIPFAYESLAHIVNKQNVGKAYRTDREEWARWLLWKAKELDKK